jgi:spore germination protein KC
MKRLILGLLLLLLLSGCGFKDLDQRFFVVAVGIDKAKSEGKRYKVTLKLAIPAVKIEAGATKFQLVSEEANSISEAVRHLKAKTDKDLNYGHAKNLVIGNDLAKNNLEEVLDWAFRRRDIQRISYVAIADPSAEKILGIKPNSENVPGNWFILSFGKGGTDTAYIATEYLFDLFRRLKEPGEDPYIPIIKPYENIYVIDQVALYDKKQMRVVLNQDETRIFNVLLRNNNALLIRIDTDEVHYSLNIDTVKVKYAFHKTAKGEPYIELAYSAKGIAEESEKRINFKDIRHYEKISNEVAAKRVTDLLIKMQKNGVDPLGFGQRYKASHHSKTEWTDWVKLYPTITFVVKANIIIEGTGVIL